MDILADAGEVMSPSADSSFLGTQLSSWTHGPAASVRCHQVARSLCSRSMLEDLVGRHALDRNRDLAR